MMWSHFVPKKRHLTCPAVYLFAWTSLISKICTQHTLIFFPLVIHVISKLDYGITGGWNGKLEFSEPVNETVLVWSDTWCLMDERDCVSLSVFLSICLCVSDCVCVCVCVVCAVALTVCCPLNYLSVAHTLVTHLELGSMEECESCQQCALLSR